MMSGCVWYILWRIAAGGVLHGHTILLADGSCGAVMSMYSILLSDYLYDGVVDVHVVLVANGC